MCVYGKANGVNNRACKSITEQRQWHLFRIAGPRRVVRFHAQSLSFLTLFSSLSCFLCSLCHHASRISVSLYSSLTSPATVYGIDHIQDLVSLAEANTRKHHTGCKPMPHHINISFLSIVRLSVSHSPSVSLSLSLPLSASASLTVCLSPSDQPSSRVFMWFLYFD